MDDKLKGLKLHHGDSARKLSQLAFISCSRFAWSFREKMSHWDSLRCIEVMEENFSEPSYSLKNLGDGPLNVWVFTNESYNKIIHIESWKEAEPPRFYIFTNEEPGVMNRELINFIKWLNRNVRNNFKFKVINGGLK